MRATNDTDATYDRILNTSMNLFLTKGYEQTSLNDIIQSLGDLTKGAIYYHFKSKEDILIAGVTRICHYENLTMKNLINDHTLTGKQRIEKMYQISVGSPKKDTIFEVTPNILNNPTILACYIHIILEDTIPNYIIPIVREGVEDGSIRTDYPDELANFLIFMTDLWLNPLVMPMDDGEIIRRVMLSHDMMKPFGLSLFNEDLIKHLTRYNRIIHKKT